MMPDKVKIKEIKEPYIFTNILVPTEYIGPIMELCQDKEVFIRVQIILIKQE